MCSEDLDAFRVLILGGFGISFLYFSAKQAVNEYVLVLVSMGFGMVTVNPAGRCKEKAVENPFPKYSCRRQALLHNIQHYDQKIGDTGFIVDPQS